MESERGEQEAGTDEGLEQHEEVGERMLAAGVLCAGRMLLGGDRCRCRLVGWCQGERWGLQADERVGHMTSSHQRSMLDVSVRR